MKTFKITTSTDNEITTSGCITKRKDIPPFRVIEQIGKISNITITDEQIFIYYNIKNSKSTRITKIYLNDKLHTSINIQEQE